MNSGGALALVGLAVALASCAAPERLDEPARYANPVLGRDFPDPAVLRAPDGWFYAYATQSDATGATRNIQVARSSDLVRWAHLGDALPRKPTWASSKQALWAPHVLHDASQKKYFMYYSAEPDHATGKCLAVATAETPAGPFVDSGAPLVCGDGIEHIDPMAFDDPQTGKRLLYWGSGGKPIRAQELAPDRMGFLAGSKPVELLFADRARPYRSLIEGAWVTLREQTYYLFFSGDRCCASEPRYAVMVARAGNALGPFEELETPVIRASAAWLAPGHASIVADERGDDWLIYHAIHAGRQAARRDRSAERVMLIDRLEYRAGWPQVHEAQPSSGPRTVPQFSVRHSNGR